MIQSTSLILAMCFGLACSFRVAENVIFEKVQDISVIRSSWIFSFFTDLAAYEGYMQRLEDNLQKTKRHVERTIQECSGGTLSTHFLPMYQGQLREVESLEDMYSAAREDLTDMQTIQTSRTTRVKRALLPIVGKALSLLFGTLTKADLKKIHEQIDLLGENQQQVIHVLNDTLSILNITNVEVQRNRHAIKAVNKQLLELGRHLSAQAMELRQALKNTHEFLLTYLQLDLMITELREAIEKGMFYIQDVKLSLDQLALGHIAPQSLTPGELKRILVEIQAQIPKYLMLPAAIEDVWYYYKTLTCVTLVRDGRFITLVNLPLIEVNSQFEVYQIHNIPLPYPRVETKLSCKYELESETFAVNTQRTDYLLLTQADLTKCVSATTSFCTLSAPLYKLADSDLCVVALFKQDQSAIERTCRSKVQFNRPWPQAHYLHDGVWLIVSDTELQFTVMCLQDNARQVKTRPPVDTLHMDPACTAYSETVTLPPYYHKQSEIDGTVDQRKALLKMRNNTHFALWTPLTQLFNGTDLELNLDLSDLPDKIQDMNIDELKQKLDQLKKPGPSNQMTIGDYLGYIATPLVVLCILSTLFIMCCPKRRVQLCRAMAKIRRAGTGKSSAGLPHDPERVGTSAESTEDQLMGDCQKAEQSLGRSALTLELKDINAN